MGFLSGLTQGLFGGSQSSSQGQGTSGFALLPKQIQDTYTNYANTVNSQIPNATAAYTPIGQTADETQAYNTIRQGFTPTADSLKSDISMLTNPFEDSVINGVNRDANSQFSILKQNMNQAGQFGSNRQALGANDIENTRENTIGNLRQTQYNDAIGQVFNNLIPQRQADAQGLLGIGNAQRTLAGQIAQAPITGLQQIGTALGVLPSNGGSQQTSSSQGTASKGLFGGLTG